MKIHLILLYLAVAAISVVAHDYFLDARFPEQAREIHEQVINQRAPAPIQYRVFTYQLAQQFVNLGFSYRYAHFSIRLLFTFLCGLLLHIYLRKWFTEKACLIGVLIFYSVLPITYLWYISQPMDLPNLFFFILGYIFIRDRKDILLFAVLFLAMFNRETSILLVLVFMFYRWDEMEFKEFVFKLFVLAVIGFGVYIGLREFYGIKEYYSDDYYLNYNLTNTHNWLYTALLFNIFLGLFWKKLSLKPKFLRRALLMAPFFLIIHFTMTIMREARLWLPMLPIILPLGMLSFMEEDVIKKTENDQPLKKGGQSVLRKLSGPLMYLIILAGFIGFFVYFFNLYSAAHLKNAGSRRQVEKFTQIADNCQRMNLYADSLTALNSALSIDPDNAEIRYKIARVYNYYLFDRDKALENYRAALKLNPYHYDKKLIDWEIRRLEAMK